MAQHAGARLRRAFPDLKITFHPPLSIGPLLADRRVLSQTTHHPPKCLLVKGFSVPESAFFSRFNLVSFDVHNGYIRTFHRDDSTVSDLYQAFENCATVTIICDDSQFRHRVIDIVLQNLIAAATADCTSWLVRDLACPPPLAPPAPLPSPKAALRRHPKRHHAPLPNPPPFAFDFESIRQPEVDRGSSRLTPYRVVPEWHKREYLRPYAKARQFPFVASRKSGGPFLLSQASRDAGSGPRTYWEKSLIHGFGLFALEQIHAGELVCNYTGQLIRMQVADRREERAQRRGKRHTFMFRIGANVIDATNAGCNARFLNCSCEPNCRAETVQAGGAERVSFFATRAIRAHEEITFDFKMQLEKDPNKWERCYCCAPSCNVFLNFSVDRDVLERRKREEDNGGQSDSEAELS